MNPSKLQDPRFWGKAMASGAVETNRKITAPRVNGKFGRLRGTTDPKVIYTIGRQVMGKVQ